MKTHRTIRKYDLVYVGNLNTGFKYLPSGHEDEADVNGTLNISIVGNTATGHGDGEVTR